MSSDTYIVKWKGEEFGPYTLRQIQDKAASREIKGIYEVLDRGEWKTVRVFLREASKNAPVPSGPTFGLSHTTSAREESAHPLSSPPALPNNPEATDRAYGRSTAPHRSPEEPVWESAGGFRGAPIDSREPDERVILVYAGFWTRLLASLLDFSLVFALPVLLVARFVPPTGNGGALDALASLGAIGVIMVLLASVLAWIYFAALESSGWGATLGKKIVGLVVTSEDGERITFQRATVRHFSKMLSAAMAGAGFFLAAFTRKKQAFHDLLSRSTVNLSIRESRILQGTEPLSDFNHHG